MSTIIVDTLTGKSTATTITIGSTPVVSASAKFNKAWQKALTILMALMIL